MFKATLKRLRERAKALHRDERGADMLEYMLIVAAVALPLLFVVIWFWKDIKTWAQDLWTGAKGRAESGIPDDN